VEKAVRVGLYQLAEVNPSEIRFDKVGALIPPAIPFLCSFFQLGNQLGISHAETITPRVCRDYLDGLLNTTSLER